MVRRDGQRQGQSGRLGSHRDRHVQARHSFQTRRSRFQTSRIPSKILSPPFHPVVNYYIGLLRDLESQNDLTNLQAIISEVQNRLSVRLVPSYRGPDWSTDARRNYRDAEPGSIIQAVSYEPLGDLRGNPTGSPNHTATPNGPVFSGTHPAVVLRKHIDMNEQRVLSVAWCGTYGGRASALAEQWMVTPDSEFMAFLTSEDLPRPAEIPRRAKAFKVRTRGQFLRNDKRFTLVDFRKVGLVYCDAGMSIVGRVKDCDLNEFCELADRPSRRALSGMPREAFTTTVKHLESAASSQSPQASLDSTDSNGQSTHEEESARGQKAAPEEASRSTGPLGQGPSDMTLLARGVSAHAINGTTETGPSVLSGHKLEPVPEDLEEVSEEVTDEHSGWDE